ncbi:7321_t:CDS:1, partial [Gigaspora margarita]
MKIRKLKKKQFALEYRSTAIYILCGQPIVGNSWFGLPKLCILLIENGLYSIFHIKKRCGWPLNYSQNIIQKLGNTYRSKVAIVNSAHLIVVSLKDQKLQCIIATTQNNKVEHIVKECNNSSLVKFTWPKIFSEYFSSK